MARLKAVELNDKEGSGPAGAALVQAIALIFSMLASQVLSRVSRLTFSQVVALEVTAYEAAATVSTVALLLCAVGISAVGTTGTAYAILFLTCLLLIFILPFTLWRIVVEVDAKRVSLPRALMIDLLCDSRCLIPPHSAPLPPPPPRAPATS